MAERDRMFKKHPKTTFIAAHFGWHANDLARLATAVRRDAERLHRGRRDPRRPRPPAARRARVLRQVPGPDPVRQGQLPARRVPVLLARVRDQRRVLRLLPRLPRVLEAVRHGAARRRAEEAVLQERAEARARAAARTGLAAANGSLSRHRRRRLHRLASGRRAAACAATRARGRQPDHRQARQPRGGHGRGAGCRRHRHAGVPRRRPGRSGGRRSARSPGIDYVLHQAAIPSVPRSVDDPIASNRANIDATLQRAGRGARRRREAAGLRRVVVGLRRRRRAAEARGHAGRARCRRMRCRSWSASSTCRCSPRSTASRP